MDPEEVPLSISQETPAKTLEEMPILTVRDTVMLPGAVLPITVGPGA